MTLKEWLKDVSYDEYGQYLWSECFDGDFKMIGSVRGWGELKNLFKTNQEAMEFQDKVGNFIADAINEKVKRDLP